MKLLRLDPDFLHTHNVRPGDGETMDSDQALVNSLGEYTVTAIGRSHLRTLTATYDHVNGLAHIEICLSDDSWDARAHAIDKMLEVREMFLDEVSIDYAFSSPGMCAVETEVADAEFAFAVA